LFKGLNSINPESKIVVMIDQKMLETTMDELGCKRLITWN
jgi:hypothetical protein